jgi:hypothetical protein
MGVRPLNQTIQFYEEIKTNALHEMTEMAKKKKYGGKVFILASDMDVDALCACKILAVSFV